MMAPFYQMEFSLQIFQTFIKSVPWKRDKMLHVWREKKKDIRNENRSKYIL